MTSRTALCFSMLTIFAAAVLAVVTVPEIKWKTGDRSRPLPPKVTPGSASTDERAGAAPSDAVVLFDGKDLSAWQHTTGKPARWTVGSGYFEVAPKTGDLVTKQAFGDAQLHIEWATPSVTHGKDQEPGNSGVFLASTYEVQVLDSYENVTYPDGQAGAIYCQYPPLVNASLPPGRWQTYDIIFHGPRFSESGELLQTAQVTVLHNGVLVQDNVTPTGPTAYMQRPPYQKHGKMPLKLQDHGQPVRYRNIWVRELATGS
jgi:hypothetical protein